MNSAEVLNSVTLEEPLASVPALAVAKGSPETASDDNSIGLGLVAPHASNAADVDSLDDDAKMEISDWLIAQSDKAFKGSKVFEALGEARSFQTVAMLALDLALFPKKDWDMALKMRDINPEGFKYKYASAKAVAAALGLDPRAEDDKVRDKAQRDIDRLSPSVDWLTHKILAMTTEERKTITFDDAGIAALVQVLKSKGLTEAAKAQRDFSNTPEAERGLKIEISTNQGHDVLVKAGKQALCSQAGSDEAGIEPEIVVLAEIAGKQIPVPLDQKLLRTIRDHVFAAAAPVDPAVDVLGELLQIGKMVEERETNLPTNDVDDPRDPSTKKRLTTRHFVLRPDKSVLISPILAEDLGSPVVVAKLPDFIIDVHEGELLELETRGRRKAEANIADPSRRRFFKSSIGTADGTQGRARVLLTTDAAADECKRTEDVGVLVQPLRSAKDNLPLDVSASSFKTEFGFALTTAMLQLIAKELPSKSKATAKATSKGQGSKAKPTIVAKLAVKGEAGTIELGSKTVTFDVQAPTKDGTVRVIAGHLQAFVRTVVDIPLTSRIDVAVDQTGGVRFSFTTKLAAYEVYAPALMKDSDQPSNRYFAVIKAE